LGTQGHVACGDYIYPYNFQVVKLFKQDIELDFCLYGFQVHNFGQGIGEEAVL
jgi:hypothetical protein